MGKQKKYNEHFEIYWTFRSALNVLKPPAKRIHKTDRGTIINKNPKPYKTRTRYQKHAMMQSYGGRSPTKRFLLFI